MKSLLIAGFFALLLFSTLPAFYVLSSASGAEEQPVALALQNTSVVYEMPYPGILPDNPLYFMKIFRDRVTEFLTRDNIKKARLYLNYSDKRVMMAVKLSEKGKNQMALSTLSKAEKYFEKIPDLLKNSKKQGISPPSDLILQLKLSNQKHQEITQSMLESFPQGERDTFQDILRINKEIATNLQQY